MLKLSLPTVPDFYQPLVKHPKVLKVVVIETPNPKAPGEKTWEIRALPTEQLGRVLKWMQAHIYYGLASGVIVCMEHSGTHIDAICHQSDAQRLYAFENIMHADDLRALFGGLECERE